MASNRPRSIACSPLSLASVPVLLVGYFLHAVQAIGKSNYVSLG